MNLDLFVLGTGGMMPLPHRHLTSVLLRREGDLFLFDCGESTQVALRKLNLRWKKISAIFISHTHADHVTGLPGLLMLSSQVDREDPLHIYGPPRIREFIEVNRKALEMYINYEIIVHEVYEPGVYFEKDDFRIRCVDLKHSRPCVGWIFEEYNRPGVFYPDKAKELKVPVGAAWSKLQKGESVENEDGDIVNSSQVLGPERPGRKVSFITDTGYFPELAKELSDSDVLICEGMFTRDLEESAAEKRHLTSSQAASLAKAAGGVKSLGLIHYSPRFTEWELKTLLNEAKEIFEDTFLTRDGKIISIPNKE